MTTSPSFSPFQFKPMPLPQSADAPRFDGTILTDFLDILSRHGERAGLSLDELTSVIVSYCTPEVRHVVRYLPELQRDARSWHDAVSELRSLYGSLDDPVTYTIADLHEFCRGSCSGPPFRSLSDAEAYLRRYTQISGSLHELGFLAAAEVQVYFVAGLPFETRKDVEARLPDANRGTDSPPTKHQFVHILRDLLRRDSFETFVANRLFPTRSSSSPSSSDISPPSDSQSRDESKSKRRSNRCFVCGGTNTHRLGPKFCPQTWELVVHGLAKFDADGRLVSHDGSALPMTRNSGGVAAHLFASSDRHSRRISRDIPQLSSPSAVPRVDVPSRDLPSNPNPPQSPIAVRRHPSSTSPPNPLPSISFDDSPSLSRSNLNPPHRSCSPRMRTDPVVPSVRIHPSSPDKIPGPHSPPSLHAEPSSTGLHPPPYPKSNLQHSHSSNSSPFPSSIHPSHRDPAPKLSDLDVDPNQLVTLSFADLLAISPPMRAKVAAFIHHLDSKPVSKPAHDPCPLPVTPSHIPNSFNSTRNFIAASISPSSLFLVLITWALSSYISSLSKHLGSYDYLTDMISFLSSHATRLLIDYILI
ncbi:hypothetical protein MVEN_00089500 [Mycena venus]|uniref:Uncharacterized protein n=1 Tax=Mycena venus TaxID=2733690 RepID=A0A8H7DFC1_9AGAR|nr:hypothetical protein MVEN_00089500 [Mycena venus]